MHPSILLAAQAIGLCLRNLEADPNRPQTIAVSNEESREFLQGVLDELAKEVPLCGKINVIKVTIH